MVGCVFFVTHLFQPKSMLSSKQVNEVLTALKDGKSVVLLMDDDTEYEVSNSTSFSTLNDAKSYRLKAMVDKEGYMGAYFDSFGYEKHTRIYTDIESAKRNSPKDAKIIKCTWQELK